MIDMKVSELEKKEASQTSVLNESSNYPYNLRLYLGPEEVEKLNLSGCQIGEKLVMHAMVEVVSVSSENSKGDEKQVSVSLQIQQMDLDKKEEKEPAFNALYGAT